MIFWNNCNMIWKYPWFIGDKVPDTANIWKFSTGLLLPSLWLEIMTCRLQISLLVFWTLAMNSALEIHVAANAQIPTVLFCWGCHNNCTLSGLNNRNVLSLCSGGWRWRQRSQQGCTSIEGTRKWPGCIIIYTWTPPTRKSDGNCCVRKKVQTRNNIFN